MNRRRFAWQRAVEDVEVGHRGGGSIVLDAGLGQQLSGDGDAAQAGAALDISLQRLQQRLPTAGLSVTPQHALAHGVVIGIELAQLLVDKPEQARTSQRRSLMQQRALHLCALVRGPSEQRGAQSRTVVLCPIQRSQRRPGQCATAHFDRCGQLLLLGQEVAALVLDLGQPQQHLGALALRHLGYL